MANIWVASREGGMAPAERALVLGALMVVIATVAWLTDDKTGAEAMRAWEVPSEAAGSAVIGLLTIWPWWLRALVAGLVLGSVEVATEATLGRPHALDAGVIAADLLAWGLMAGVVVWADPPAALREHATGKTTTAGRWWAWGAYYVTSAALVFVFLMGVVGLVSGLVHTVLPSPGLIKEDDGAPRALLVGGGIAALGLLVTLQAWGRWVVSAAPAADGRGVVARLQRGVRWGAWGVALGACAAVFTMGWMAELVSPAMCLAIEAVVALLAPAVGLFFLGLWWPVRWPGRGRVSLMAGGLGASFAGTVALLASVAGLDWVARSLARGTCGETIWSSALGSAVDDIVSGWQPLVVLGAMLAAAFLAPPARGVRSWLRAVSLVNAPATERARWKRGVVWAVAVVLATSALAVLGVAMTLDDPMLWCDSVVLPTNVVSTFLTITVLGVWWPAGPFRPVRWGYALGALWAVVLAVAAAAFSVPALLGAGVSIQPAFRQCPHPWTEGRTVGDMVAGVDSETMIGLVVAFALLVLLRPIWAGMSAGFARLRGRSRRVAPATVADGALGRWARREG